MSSSWNDVTISDRKALMEGPEPSPRWDWRDVALGTFVMVCALAIRLAYVVQSQASPTADLPIVDGQRYLRLAQALAEGRAVTEDFFWQPVLYPLWLAAFCRFSATPIVAAKIAQAVVGSTTCLLTFILGRCAFGRVAGTCAGLFLATYGPLVFLEAELLGTGWEVFFSVALMLLIWRLADRPSRMLAAGTGLCSALATLVRPTFLPFLLAAGVWLISRLRHKVKILLGLSLIAMVAAGWLVLLLPAAWFAASVRQPLALSPLSAGINLYIGNHPDPCSTINIRPGLEWESLVALPRQHGATGAYAQRSFFLAEVWKGVREQPLKVFRTLGRKVLQLVTSRELPRNTDLYLFRRWSPVLQTLVWKAGPFGFPFGLLFPLAMLGMTLAWQRTPAVLLLFLSAYGSTLVLVLVSSRYRMPLVPGMCVLAGAGAAEIVCAFRRWQARQLGPAAAVATASLALCVLPGPFCEERQDYEPELYYALGSSAQAQGDTQRARTFYQEALARRPDYVEVQNNLGLVLLELGETDKAEEILRKALGQQPNQARIQTNLAIALLRQNRLPEALLALDQALQRDPTEPRAHYYRGVLLEQRGNLEAAIGEYEIALSLAPGDPIVLNSLGGVWLKCGNTLQAIDAFRQALRYAPQRAELYANLGAALVQGRQFAAAARAYEQAVSLRPDQAQWHASLGDALALSGHSALAIASYRRSLQLDPDQPHARANLDVLLAAHARIGPPGKSQPATTPADISSPE